MEELLSYISGLAVDTDAAKSSGQTRRTGACCTCSYWRLAVESISVFQQFIFFCFLVVLSFCCCARNGLRTMRDRWTLLSCGTRVSSHCWQKLCMTTNRYRPFQISVCSIRSRQCRRNGRSGNRSQSSISRMTLISSHYPFGIYPSYQ